LDARTVLFIENQAVEDCQDLFAVIVNALEVIPEMFFEIFGSQPFVKHGTRDVNVLPESLYRVTP
jgi:hypothetical protein